MRLAALRGWLRDVADFCYPGRCAACDDDCAGSSPVCTDCFARLKRLEGGAACEKCAKPLVSHGDPCPYCLGAGIKPYDRVLRLGVFRDPIREILHRMKYRGRWPLAEYFAERLAAQEPVRQLIADADCLVPVPLHRLRQMSRGYNQSHVLAKALARGQLKVARPVVRLRHTDTQIHLHSRTQREENLRDAFGLVAPKLIHGKRIVVVDDVMTTGATLRAFARALRPARPASMSAVVIAVADARGSDFQMI